MRLRSANKSNKGFSLAEILVVLFVIGVLLTITAVTSRRASMNRAWEAGCKELESATNLARQVATNSNGSKMVLVSPTDTAKGSWQITATDRLDKQGELAPGLTLTQSPTGEIKFTAAGTISNDIAITLASPGTSKSQTWILRTTTGLLERQ